eukprot:CAMPEP_0119019142 /NCGR_PEP_ID=MMETSP1176-20130426/21088_1 /TAXON_ID=265551 /ORGANISM="Synedropsis recta cf, Strain CCMP1620" /LENGTH=50 /DNA_ID=CAMNT_0006973283 /DNA_START=83 /DNA_END=232 /DNA_ORIENTATION=+
MSIATSFPPSFDGTDLATSTTNLDDQVLVGGGDDAAEQDAADDQQEAENP